MSSFTDCEGDACWAAGWLQHSVTISAITAESEGLAGPLTKDLKPDSFSTRVVEFDPLIISIMAILLTCVVAHEMWATYRKPLLANHDQANSPWLQIVYLNSWFSMFFIMAMTVPVSLDFAMQLGESATMSGFYLSSPIIGSIVGIIIGRMLTSESEWNQPFVRRLMVVCPFLSLICTMLTATIVNNAALLSLPRRKFIFWIVILLQEVSTLVSAIPCVPMLVMQNKVTPNSEKTFWMILAQCARNGGMLIGPGFFAVIAFAVKRGEPVAPSSLMGWVDMGFLIFGGVITNYASLVIPTQLAPLPDEPTAPETEVCVTMLPSAERERVVKNMIWYSFERPFSIAAIEVGTIMLLEVSYGWTTELCGTAFTIVAGTSLLFSAVSSVLLSRKYLSESHVFFGANMVGLFGVLFLFDFGTGPAGLLLADGLVYGMASVANGIAEAWASKATMPGTGFSIEIYRMQNTICVNCARLISPIVARTLLDFGGRNVYACLQLFIVCLGTSTVYKTVRMVWDQPGSEDLKAGIKAKAEAAGQAEN